MTMRMSMGVLMTRLRAEGLATDADTESVRAALAAGDEREMPMYLRALVGLGAWVATIMLVAFFWALHLFRERNSAFLLGALLCGGAAGLRRRASGEFWRHAAIATSFAGQGLILAAAELTWHSNETTFTLAAMMSVAMIVVFPDPLHRFVSAACVVGATAVALSAQFVPHPLDVTALLTVLACGFVWRGSLTDRSDELTEVLAPVGYGLAVGLFALCLFAAFFSGIDGRNSTIAMGTLATDGVAVLLALFVMIILREHDTSPSSVAGATILVVIALFAWITLKSPGIVIGVAMLLLGFDRRNLVLVELATAFLIVFGAANYYNLDLTLLEKSGVLVASGVVCLLARVLLGKRPLARDGVSS